MGLHRAGFSVTGLDLNPQPRYPFPFIQGDALEANLTGYDFIWASPPCQKYSMAQRLMQNEHPDLIDPIRTKLIASGIPYCIENVQGAPLINPVVLCGPMFGLATYRHRGFECSFSVAQPDHAPHTVKQTKMGRHSPPGEFIQVVGNFMGQDKAKKAMGIEWMNRRELAESIPPAYSQYIALQFLASKN